MKVNELKQALRMITKVQADPRIGPDFGDQLKRAKRELQAVAQSGKLDGPRVLRAVEIVATVLLKIVDDDEATPK